MTFCEPPYHVSNPPRFQSYSNLPGPSAHISYIGTLTTVKIPSGTHHKVCNDFQHQHNQSIQKPYFEFTPSPQHYFYQQIIEFNLLYHRNVYLPLHMLQTQRLACLPPSKAESCCAYAYNPSAPK